MSNSYPLVYIPDKFSKPPYEFTSKEAKEYFEWFKQKKDERLKILCEFMKTEALPLAFSCDYSKESLRVLFRCTKKAAAFYYFTDQEVREAEKTHFLKIKGDMGPTPTKEIDQTTISFCFDAGIYYGETRIRNSSGLMKWISNSTAKKFIDYAQPIIVKEGSTLSLNPIRFMKGIARDILNNKITEDSFIELFERAQLFWEER